MWQFITSVQFCKRRKVLGITMIRQTNSISRRLFSISAIRGTSIGQSKDYRKANKANDKDFFFVPGYTVGNSVGSRFLSPGSRCLFRCYPKFWEIGMGIVPRQLTHRGHGLGCQEGVLQYLICHLPWPLFTSL
jgi:hypothetical protein